MIQECRALGIRVVVIDTAKNDGISSHMSLLETPCVSDPFHVITPQCQLLGYTVN